MAGERFTGERPHFDDDPFALLSEIAKPLPLNSITEASGPSAWPTGVWAMPANAAANWDGNNMNSVVITTKMETGTWQRVLWHQPKTGTADNWYEAIRVWDPDASGWTAYFYTNDATFIRSIVANSVVPTPGAAKASLYFSDATDNNNGRLRIKTANGLVQRLSESLYRTVRNTTGSTIPKGTLLRYASGGNGWTPLQEEMTTGVAAAFASGTKRDATVIGVAMIDIPHNSYGLAITHGPFFMNTSALSGEIYLAPGGGFTSTRPTGDTEWVTYLGRADWTSTNAPIWLTIQPPRATSEFVDSYSKTDADSRYAPIDHAHFNLTPLATNSRAATDLPSAYPVGESMMYIQGEAGWLPENSSNFFWGTVITINPDPSVSPIIYQDLNYWWDEGDYRTARRFYDYTTDGWGGWFPPNTLGLDAHAPSTPISEYPEGVSGMQTTASGWPEGEDDAGFVITEHLGTVGRQRYLVQPPKNHEYVRWSLGNSWTEWQQSGSGITQEEADERYSRLLPDDSILATDGPGAWPYGESSMRAIDYDTPGTFGQTYDVGLVVTRKSTYGDYSWAGTPEEPADWENQPLVHQWLFADGYQVKRSWNFRTLSWRSWQFTEVSLSDLEDRLLPQYINYHNEEQTPAEMGPRAYTAFRVSASGNWGPDDGYEGTVVVERDDGSNGIHIRQTFYRSDGARFTRYSLLSTTWTDWESQTRVLPTDSRLFTDEPDAWPDGTTQMLAQSYDLEDSFGWWYDVGIVTNEKWSYAETDGGQTICTQTISGDGYKYKRSWDYTNGWWGGVARIDISQDDVDNRLAPMSIDYLQESNLPHQISNYRNIVFYADASENWGPDDGYAGMVTMERSGTNALASIKQRFLRTDGKEFYRIPLDYQTWGVWKQEIDKPLADTLYSALGHHHTASEIDDFVSAVAGAIPSTVATDAEVASAISTAINNLINSAPGTLDTLGEIASALQGDESAIAALTTAVNARLTQAQADALYKPIAYAPSWAEITGKPTLFTQSAADLLYKSINYAPSWTEITSKPSTFAPSSHAGSHKGDGSDPIANATQTVAGLESAADKIKLDGIEAAATAQASRLFNQTATVPTEAAAPNNAANANGFIQFTASAADNWGPNTGEAGIVTVSHAGGVVRQTFTRSDGTTWERAGLDNSTTWTPWISVIKSDDTRLTDQRVPTDGSVTSAKLATALANTINGKLDAASYTAADVFAKVLTQDGTGTGLDADFLDGAHLSALMQAATYVGGDGKILVGKLPDTVVGGMDYQGTWNASTNSPSLTDSYSGSKGDYYKVSANGATSLNSITDWKVGDWAVWNGTAWDKIDNTDSVSSVDGQTGAVSLSSTYKAIGYVPTWAEITSKPSQFDPDAAAGTKGVTRLSVAPASPTAPIAVGDNDSRVANVEHTTNKDQANGYPGLNASSLIADSVISTAIARVSALSSYQATAGKDVNGGYAGRDSNGGVLMNYVDMVRQSSTPAAPLSGGARLFIGNVGGNSALQAITETGEVFRFLRDQLFFGYNNTGATIPKGALIRVTGWDATNSAHTIALADSSNESTMMAEGFAYAAIPNNSVGRVWQIGLLEDVNTSGMTAGATLFLGASGAYTTTKPTTVGACIQIVGSVAVVSATVGKVRVNVAPGYEVIAASGGGTAATQGETDAETNDTAFLTPLKHAAASLSHRKYDTGSAAVTAEGDTRYESTRKDMLFHDGVRERGMNNKGFMPYAFPIGGGPGQAASGTAISMGASGGANAIPIVLEGHMLLQSVSVWTTDTTQTRGPLEFGIYEERLNNSNTLDLVTGAVGSLAAVAATVAVKRDIPVTSPPVYLAPGTYWLVLKSNGNNANATWTMGVTAVGAMAANTWQQKILTTSALGATLDFVAATWTKQTTIPVVRLNGRVFGQAASF